MREIICLNGSGDETYRSCLQVEHCLFVDITDCILSYLMLVFGLSISENELPLCETIHSSIWRTDTIAGRLFKALFDVPDPERGGWGTVNTPADK